MCGLMGSRRKDRHDGRGGREDLGQELEKCTTAHPPCLIDNLTKGTLMYMTNGKANLL